MTDSNVGNERYRILKDCLNKVFRTRVLSTITMAEIIQYFILAVAADCQSNNYIKSLSKYSHQTFKEGHVQGTIVHNAITRFYLYANKKRNLFGELLRRCVYKCNLVPCDC